MADYQHKGPNDVICNIGNGDDAAFIALGKASAPMRPAIEIPAGERQAAAQALAGDRFEVIDKGAYDNLIAESIDAAQTAQPNHPEPVDPASVAKAKADALRPSDWNIGDIAEIESADGLSLVRGEVKFGDHLDFRLIVQPGNQWINLDPDYHGTHDGSSARVLRRAERRHQEGMVPEPDPAAVEALRQVMRDTFRVGSSRGVELDEEWIERHALALAKSNVRVVTGDA